MTINPKSIAQSYFETWRTQDFDAFRSLLDKDVSFIGPLAQIHNADDCVAGIKGLSKIVTDIVIQHMWVDGAEVITWFDLYTNKTSQPLSVVNWSHIENGKIKRIRVTFDPRPLMA